MNAKNRGKDSNTGKTTKPKQTRPNLSAGLSVPLPASVYLQKAQQAYAANQWQQVCTLAQTCITAAKHDAQTRYHAMNLLAVALVNLNQREQALAVWVNLHNSLPNDAMTINNIGLLLTHMARYEEAIKCFQGATTLAPDNLEFLMSLGLAYYKNRDFSLALSTYQSVAAHAPQHVQAKFGIGWALQALGLIDEAMIAYENVLALEPKHFMALGNMIFMHYAVYPFDIQRQIELVRRFGTAIEVVTPTTSRKTRLQPHAPLKIGIVSADLHYHVVCRFLTGVLTELNLEPQLRTKLTLVAYANQAIQDDHTNRLLPLFDQWRRVDEWSDSQLIAQIKQDQIDILIDLSGHTLGNRLPVFAQQAAPLQISWLGYWGSTGVANIDYILADPISVPPDEESLYREKIWRLPHLRYCFSAPAEAPEPSPPPCLSQPHIVFGCYQTTNKINDGVLRCWAQILAASTTARLRIQSLEFAKTELKARFITRIQHAGLDPQRVDLIEGMATKEYLASYAEVDILLDTFPYPGGTTTAEALWMGVPTITLASIGMLGRQGEALLVNAGLTDWVAQSEAEYVQKATAWANADATRRQALDVLRKTMRQNVQNSPVFNAKGFAAEFVDALYGMWQAKCDAVEFK